jgi:hypothetical protein
MFEKDGARTTSNADMGRQGDGGNNKSGNQGGNQGGGTSTSNRDDNRNTGGSDMNR